MNYQFRNEVTGIKKAAMGEMFQLAKEHLEDKGKLINFASGHPSTEVFQEKLIRKYINLAVEKCDQNSFEYDIQGYEPLMHVLKAFVNQKGNTIKTEDDLLITYGSTEAVYLAASALVGYGDKVVVEVPSYVNAIKSFRLLGGEVIGVHMEDDGVNIDELENIMKCGGGGYLCFIQSPILEILPELRCLSKKEKQYMNWQENTMYQFWRIIFMENCVIVVSVCQT